MTIDYFGLFFSFSLSSTGTIVWRC